MSQNELTNKIRELKELKTIAIAKRENKYKGRKSISIPDFEKHYQRYLKREITKSELAKELKISRPTLDKLINGK